MPNFGNAFYYLKAQRNWHCDVVACILILDFQEKWAQSTFQNIPSTENPTSIFYDHFYTFLSLFEYVRESKKGIKCIIKSVNLHKYQYLLDDCPETVIKARKLQFSISKLHNKVEGKFLLTANILVICEGISVKYDPQPSLFLWSGWLKIFLIVLHRCTGAHNSNYLKNQSAITHIVPSYFVIS